MTKHAKDGCPVPAGVIVIVGGKENKGEQPEEEIRKDAFIPFEVLNNYTSLIKKKEPVVEVVTSASSIPDEVFDEYKKAFSQLGINHVRQIHHETRKDVLSDGLEERLKEADGIYFTGGDQLKLSSLYGGTDFLQILKFRYIRERIIIGGTSAGAMALSTPMIYAGNNEVQQIAGEIRITTGLEFLKDVCIDTHFVHRGRFVRMAQVIATNPSCIGIGLEEDTGMIVKNGVEAEIIGSGIVIIIDGFQIEKTNVEDFNEKKTGIYQGAKSPPPEKR